MKRKPIIVAILLIVTLYACTKERNMSSQQNLSTDAIEDSVYKAKLENLLNIKLRPATAEEMDTSNHSVIHLGFKTLREEYEYFDSVMNKKSIFENGGPVSITGNAARLSIKTPDGSGTLYAVSYTHSTVLSASVANSALINQVYVAATFNYGVLFTSNTSGGYTYQLTSNSATVTGYTASSSLGYAEPAPLSSVVMTPSGAGGSITGFITVLLTAAGTSGSIVVSVSGSYSLRIPSTPTGQSIVIASMSAAY